MKCIPVQEAVGAILCHDITQILPGEFKGRRFKKGHIIQEEDIPVMAKHADKEGNPLYPVPMLMNRKELENIYKKVKGQET